MIYTFEEQVIFSIYFIFFGIFIGIVFDIISFYRARLKKITSIIWQIIFWLIIIYISYKYSYKVSKGYIPIYVFLFYAVGLFIYFSFFSQEFIKTIGIINEKIKKIYNKFRKAIFIIVIPKEVLGFIKKIFRRRKNEKNIVNDNITDNANDS